MNQEPSPQNINLLVDANRLIPESVRVRLVETRLSLYNKATFALYRHLRKNLGKPQWIIAHSQGNLITCDALWAVVYSYGESALNQMEVFSLASPSPGWAAQKGADFLIL
ncbi:hypothetical protein [Fimbriiglobus ruber]|uniref:Uncharacterized protein n=1 Tax=Fimbriiglobus ruber TaxID=1908690 RepID=A0A225DSG2_9BACT|nr:hypothetical protein [Fimbriiglobus ruber]OWK39335.1 hypothetical protein FRUB_05898 [Fimbriiglobus ruber]